MFLFFKTRYCPATDNNYSKFVINALKKRHLQRYLFYRAQSYICKMEMEFKQLKNN